MALASCMPTIGSVTAGWASLTEAGLFIGVASSMNQLAPVFTMPLSGALCVSPLGWPSVYYVHSAVTLVLFLLWAGVYHDKPSNSQLVGGTELKHISEGKAVMLSSRTPLSTANRAGSKSGVPYSRILRTKSIWVIWLSALANIASMYLIILFAPTYINKVLRFSIGQTGLLAAIPTLIQFFVKLFAGHCSDRITCLGDTAKVKICNTIALSGMGSFFVALALIPPSNQRLSLVMLIFSATILGFNVSGFFKSAVLVARHFCPFVMGIIQLIGGLNLLIVPLVVEALTPENSVEQWRLLFFVHAGMLAFASVLFCFFGSGQPAIWAQNQTVQGDHEQDGVMKLPPPFGDEE
uniref:Major facilitator superfamily (MFS) profile domain-containing protein n=1 Tax=Plectus sambesii TaxID=2011161 RepID=A0A914X275_9BILA